MERALTYSSLAPLYDAIMAHVNYRQWARYVQTLIALHQAKTRYVADLACGTGSLLKHIKRRRWRLWGCDRSAAMIAQAQKKDQRGVSWCVADFKHLPLRSNQFDAVVILYDSINYCLNEQEVQAVFSETARVLKRGGLLIFDAVLPYVCQEVFNDYRESKILPSGQGYERKTWFDAREQMQYNHFLIYSRGQVVEELHRQKVWNLAQWQRLIVEQSHLNLQAMYGDFTFREVTERSERVHMVLKK